jgi:hypothetical protein
MKEVIGYIIMQITIQIFYTKKLKRTTPTLQRTSFFATTKVTGKLQFLNCQFKLHWQFEILNEIIRR